MKKIYVITTMCVAWSCLLNAADLNLKTSYEKTFSLHKKHGPESVMKHYKSLCRQSEMRSCRNLGIISYKRGWKTIGRRLLKKSCIGGEASACNFLGFLYEKLGHKVSASMYYKLACDRGHMGGCLALN